MSNIIPFRRNPDLTPVYVGEDESAKMTPVEVATVKTLAVAQLKKALKDIEEGKIRPDAVLILVQEDNDEDTRLMYYAHGVNRMEMIGLLHSTATTFSFEDDDNVTAR